MSSKANNREAMTLHRSRKEPPYLPLGNAKGKTADVFEVLPYTRDCDQGSKAMYWQQQQKKKKVSEIKLKNKSYLTQNFQNTITKHIRKE